MHGGMTRRHEGPCEHDAHQKRLEYCTAAVSLQGVSATKWRVQDDKHAYCGAFRLDNDVMRDEAERSIMLARTGDSARRRVKVDPLFFACAPYRSSSTAQDRRSSRNSDAGATLVTSR